jgi:hypothetical protein
MVFEVRLVTTGGEQVPSTLDYPVTFNIPVDSTPLPAGQMLQVSTCSL